MPKYLIERQIPGAGTLSPVELRDISRTSNGVLATMAPRVQWVQSFVTDDAIYCIYIADDVEAVREHADGGGFPANVITTVRAVIDPTTAESESQDVAVPV